MVEVVENCVVVDVDDVFVVVCFYCIGKVLCDLDCSLYVEIEYGL